MGLALATHSQERKILGASVSIVVTILFFGYRLLLSSAFLEHCKDSLRGDLADIVHHYELRPVRQGAEEFVPSGASGFWVVEKERPDQSGPDIVGFVALRMPILSIKFLTKHD